MGVPEHIDYLIIGHVSRDLTPQGPRLGGTVTFSALTARVLGLRAAIVTSAPDDQLPLLAPLLAIPMTRIPAETPTTFENIYTPDGRIQTIAGRAAALSFDHIPPAWRQSRIVHLAPVADEVDPALGGSFPGALLALTPQGWMRQWDETGRVFFRRWPHAQRLLEQAHAVVLSIEDVRGDEALLQEYAGQTHVLVVTRGARGCTLFVEGQAHDIPALDVTEHDPTGAGDIFATAFLARMVSTGDPFSAARFATVLAGDSVTRAGLDSIPSADMVCRTLQSLSGGGYA